MWAIHEKRLHNYLLPRDCPRVTCYAGPQTSAGDAARFLGASSAMIAVESAWFDRIRGTPLYCYHLPPDGFRCQDECAGYFVSARSVEPAGMERVEDPIREILRRNVELRFLPELWTLRDEVAASTLQFSIIRLRNAAPRR